MEVDLEAICKSFNLDQDYFDNEMKFLKELEKDGLVEIKNNLIKINPSTPQIARIASNAFDKFFTNDANKHSKAV